MRLAIIGAGLAGLAAARRLRELRPAVETTIYEKSRGLGGRAATRRRAGCVFDHGAQLFRTPSDALFQLVRGELPAEDLHAIEGSVWVFDQTNTIAEGDPMQNREPKWTYRDGISRLGKLLGAGLAIRTETRIARLEREHAGYRLIDVEGRAVGSADAVLLTPPAPQSADILRASEVDPALRAQLANELERASYRRCISLTLAYPQPIARPFYALVNADRAHPISWLALEHLKGAERCPPGQSLLIAQMAAGWSLARWDATPEALVAEAADLVSALLDEELRAPAWSDIQRWRYALPDTGCDFAALNAAGASVGLFFAGDYTAGLGRVHLAIEQGWRAAELIGE
jgi:renalase